MKTKKRKRLKRSIVEGIKETIVFCVFLGIIDYALYMWIPTWHIVAIYNAIVFIGFFLMWRFRIWDKIDKLYE